MPGTLYLLPAQLGDCAWQAVLPPLTREVACRLKFFIAENAKSARATLKWLGHPHKMRELMIEQMPETLTKDAIDRLLAPLHAGHDTGLLSEAGCPAIADPGALLVRRALETGLPVRPLVGPSSFLLALMASGLDGQRFAFHGYLPQREPERSRRIVALEKESRQKRQTQLFIETPYRNNALFDAVLASCQPSTLLCLASDLTLPGEYVATQRIDHWRRVGKPPIERRPTVFLLLAQADA